MPKVSPLRMLIGASPKGSKHDHVQDEHSSSCPRPPKPPSEGGAVTPRVRKGTSYATVYPHSENVPENLITPERRSRGKLSWYQRQVKNLDADSKLSKNSRTPRSVRVDKEQSLSTTGSSSVQESAVTPRKAAVRALKYCQPGATVGSLVPATKVHESSVVAEHFELEEDGSFWLEHNVQVLIRIRPLSNTEVSVQGFERCVRQDSAHGLTWIGTPDTRFTFDHVACESISQEKLFRVAGMPMVDNCMRGYNSCIFAYGQTGSGKTHTMLGNITQRGSEDRGLAPRIFEHLFATIRNEEEMLKNELLKYTCKCSFLEIYNEQITDLLDPSSTNLQVREDARRGVHVENLSEVEVTCVRDVTALLLQGASNRRVAATNMNRESSRSHSVLTCIVESKWERESVTNRRFARLNLVDLAGSERQKSTGAENERLKEAANINKSLSTLGLVIMVLVDVANGKQRHVPYRDSKLTFLLQDSLGGNSKTMIISTVSPSISCAMDTLSTLKFAQRAKFICNNAVVNEDTSRDVNALRQQIHKLKEEVSRLRNQAASSDEYDTDMASSHSERPKRRDINKMLSAEFHKLNQLRESLEAEMETKPFQSESYQRKLQDYNLENQKLRGRISELEATLAHAPTIETGIKEKELKKEIELLEESHSKTMADLDVLLKESEEERIVQATSIRNLESSINDYRAEMRDLKSQLKEAKNVQEQMEKQQVFLISEFETVLEEHNKLSDKLVKTEAREQVAKDQLRLVNWELKKKNELYDLEKELETRASAEKLLGYVDNDEKAVLEEKLRKTRRELEEARSRYQGEEASRQAREKQMDITRSEVEAETANALASMNCDLFVAKEECKAANERVIRLAGELEDAQLKCRSLTEENAQMVNEMHDKVLEIQELHEQYEDATAKLFEYLAEGDNTLACAAKEMEDILQESFSSYKVMDSETEAGKKQCSVEDLQNKLQQAFTIAKDAERKMRAFNEQQRLQHSETDQVHSELEASKKQLKESEKKTQVALLVLKHLQSKDPPAGDWKKEKEELLSELTEAKLEAAAKCKETTTVLQKFKDSQHMLKEAEQLLNALVKANENAKGSSWKDAMRKSMSEMTVTCLAEKGHLDSKLEKAKHDLRIMRQELGTFTLESMHALTDAEQEVQSTMRGIEETMRDIMSSAFSFGDSIREEYADLREKMSEMTAEVSSLLGDIRRKNVTGLEYDISLLQEAFSEAHEKKLELQDENERMQEELEEKTNEINGAEAELLKLLSTLTTVEAELRGLKETASYLSSDNNAQRQQIEALQANNARLEEEAEVKERLVRSLESELLEVSSLVQAEIGTPQSRFDSTASFKENDEVYTELVAVRGQLQASRAHIDELEVVAEKSRRVAENSQALLNEKEEEVKVLERSVQELECTISTMESQIALLKRESEMHRLMKEDLEMEVQRLRLELSKFKSLQTTDTTGFPVDKIKLLRLEEELEKLVEECRTKDAQLGSLRKHVSELVDTATKEACAYRRKIKRLEASLETRCAPQRTTGDRCTSSKGKSSGSPFKCIGLALNSDELMTNKRRVEELEAAASVREKEVFMLNAKLAQAESMTYDVVRDLLEVKHEFISSFVQADEGVSS